MGDNWPSVGTMIEALNAEGYRVSIHQLDDGWYANLTSRTATTGLRYGDSPEAAISHAQTCADEGQMKLLFAATKATEPPMPSLASLGLIPQVKLVRRA